MKAFISAVRLLVSAIATFLGLFIYYMERLAEWFLGVKRKREYVRMGRCKRCGTCCRTIALSLPKRLVFRKWAVWFFRRWHLYRYNFVFIGMEDNSLIYECLYLRKDGGCRVYRFRPRLCRDYPRQALYTHPQVYPSCGYYFVKRRRGPSFKEVLDKERG